MADRLDTDSLVAQLAAAQELPIFSFRSGDSPDRAARAMADAGLSIVEITMRDPSALGAVNAFKEVDPALTVGAGTVLSAPDVEGALDAGADFLVGPSFSESVAEAAARAGVVYIPGVMTPTEVARAMSAGLRLLKFFPATVAGGPAMLSALRGPFADALFVATGGIGAGDVAEYISLDNVAAVGRSWPSDPSPNLGS